MVTTRESVDGLSTEPRAHEAKCGGVRAHEAKTADWREADTANWLTNTLAGHEREILKPRLKMPRIRMKA